MGFNSGFKGLISFRNSCKTCVERTAVCDFPQLAVTWTGIFDLYRAVHRDTFL